MSAARLELTVKGDPKDGAQDSLQGVLGDCPFCHRALLALEAKSIPYQARYLDTRNKPAWLLEVNPEGTVPVLKDQETGTWIPDSGAIVDYIEDLYPKPATGHVADSKDAGQGFFPSFVQYLRSIGHPDEDEKKQILEDKVAIVEAFLAGNPEGPFVHGREPAVTDFELMPKLHHLDIVTRHFKGWMLLEKYPSIGTYLEAARKLPIWQATAYSEESMIDHWVPRVGSRL
ncbi:hypothetical protein QBZ16_001959 [Prototheca wickerhamii]|uniref:glutathione dehydrogenase (ascorbate) n=1 Tax=Prototheca wickerhamii TaxID=3111 RepID=A0AAD9IJ97_PROWI|nr:hypothetical protein QBZ16_001959 [Prototheca wickerhamii]